ncbi:S26 family signal peptidase [Paenibacillus sp. 1P07SE]|uniref:S26 family signal peptidase n=1 Tax=Paenibacillus sp. 1P07SE TaxID=3132209 RepID=UPI0039A532D7
MNFSEVMKLRHILRIIFFISLITLIGCSNGNGTSGGNKETNDYELPIIEDIEEGQLTHQIGHDGMYRSSQYAANAEVVVDTEYYNDQEISRGDVVYYATHESDERINRKEALPFDIARVIALPYEVVTVKEGQVYIDGEKLDTFYGQEYYNGEYVEGLGTFSLETEIEVPEGHYFVAGDVWSRIGFHEKAIARENIAGKVIGQFKGESAP